MKKILQILTVIAVCFSFTTCVFADSTHELIENKPHIVLTPNQANDELTVTLHLSKEMYDRQIATMHLSLGTSQSLQNLQNVLTIDKTLKAKASITDVHIDNQTINIVLSNTTKLFDEQVITLGTLRVDSDKLSNLTITPQTISYVYVNDSAENTMTLDCPSATLSSKSTDSGNNGNQDSNNNGGNNGNQDSNNNGGNNGNQGSNNNGENNGNQGSHNNGNSGNQNSSTDHVIVETTVINGQNVQLSDETQETIKTSAINYLKKNYGKEFENLPMGSVVKTQVLLKPLSESDLTDEQKQIIAKALEDGAYILAYYDITITATAYSKDGDVLPEINGVTITQLDKTIQLSLSIPSEYIKDNRQFGITRLHDNQVTGLSSSVKDNVITFETDSFSIYALAAKDYTQAEVKKNPDLLKQPIVKADTGDHTPIMILAFALGVSVIGIAYFYMTRKKKA